MSILPIENLLKTAGTRYGLVNLASKRTRQLLSGNPPLVKRMTGEKLTIVALRELLEGKVGQQE